jgi:hypothetical protein
MITAPLTHAPRIAFALAFAVVLAVSLMAGSLVAGAEPGPGPEQQIRPQPARIQWEDDLHGEVQDVAAGTQFAPDPSTAVGIWAAPGPDRVWVCLRPRSGLRVATDGWKPVTGGNWRAPADDPYWCTSARTGSDVEFELAQAGDR